MNFLVFGPPGAGKGTQCKLFVTRRGFVQVSTGDLLREAIKSKTELGNKAREFMDKGLLVPDELLLGILTDSLKSMDKNFILDGYPRNLNQADALEKVLAQVCKSITAAVFLEVPSSVLEERLSGRRVCEACGAVFNISLKKTRQEGLCDVCGGKLIQRSDDRIDVIKERLQVYEKNTAPLRDYYKKKGLYKEVDGNKEEEQVYSSITKVINL